MGTTDEKYCDQGPKILKQQTLGLSHSGKRPKHCRKATWMPRQS